VLTIDFGLQEPAIRNMHSSFVFDIITS